MSQQEPIYAIEAEGLGKCYGLYDRPTDRLKELLFGRWGQYRQEFWALRNVSFNVRPGEVIGLVGRNGAGKSTLLQLLCGTMQPSEGHLKVRGRISALLELGAGFNPEFTGVENVYMNAAILGLARAEVDARLDEILSFAEIGEFVHQPVKTYSSGMFVRLAFAVATSVDPDILVIDEALSVGDGAFARKSFERIMNLRDAGKTILFCSHSMYQIEALCSRAIWLQDGTMHMLGNAPDVTSSYQASLNASIARAQHHQQSAPEDPQTPTRPAPSPGRGHIVRVWGEVDGQSGTRLRLASKSTDLVITIDFAIDPSMPCPGVAIGFADANLLTVASVISVNDDIHLTIDAQGRGVARVRFPRFPLLKGRYVVSCFLTTEDGVHPYDLWEHCLVLEASQKGLEQGLVSLPRVWES